MGSETADPRPESGAATRSRATWRARLLFLLASGVVCVGLGELGLRLVLGSRLAPFYEEDPDCLYRLVPGTEKAVARPPADQRGALVVRINRDGFRGPDLRPDGEARRVLVYGDSCTLALFADLESTYPARLRTEIEQRLPGRPVEVVNAGVAGYGPDQELLKMEREIGRCHPDLAIVALFAANDMGDIVRNRIFRLDGEGRLVRGHPTLDEPLTRQFRSAHGWAIQRVVGKVLELLERGGGGAAPSGDGPVGISLRLRGQEYEEYFRGDQVVRNLFKDGYDADVSCEPDGAAAVLKTALLSAVLGRMAEVCRASGVPLAVLVIPTPMDICQKAAGFEGMRVDGSRFPKYEPSALTSAMASAAAGRGIPCLDLFGPFAAADPASLYHHDDDHWNDAGQALAARLTADFLVRQGLLK